jgi:hypothetical protein
MSGEPGESGEQVKQPGETQVSQRSLGVEELQLAAQLTQGLAARGLGPAVPGPVAPSLEPAPPPAAQHALAVELRRHLEEGVDRPRDQAELGPKPDLSHGEEQGHVIDNQPAQLQYYSIPFPGSEQVEPPSEAHLAGPELPPRKRSKVSRACDECRRKKIKCDAVSESGETPCSNCTRSNARCLFSRVPQKRGPSKGYAHLH